MWSLVDAGAGHRILRNRHNGCSIHMETGALSCSSVPNTYWTAHWQLVRP